MTDPDPDPDRAFVRLLFSDAPMPSREQLDTDPHDEEQRAVRSLFTDPDAA